MRIVVNDIAASTGGAMTVLRDFYRCVCENDTENEWFFLLGERYFDETDNVKILPMPQVKKSGIHKMWFDFVSGRKFVKSLKPDVVLSLQNITTFGLKVPRITYVHQAIPFQETKRFSLWKKSERGLAFVQYFIGAIIRRSIKKSDYVIVQTNWMKAAVCKRCRVSPERIGVVMPQVKPFHCAENVVFDETSFFYPTGDDLHKNNDAVFAASRILEQRGLNFSVTMTLPQERSDGRVDCVGRIPYEKVVSYYGASTLVFPSYIETFGYPLAEARRAGAIVLASDTAFSREVLADYENAYFFDPFKPQELADLMERVICGDIVRRDVTVVSADQGDGWLEIMNIVRRTT